MKKITVITMIFLIIITMILLIIFVGNKEIVNKITIFLSAILSLLLSFLIGYKKRKNGLINGVVIGISIATVSLIVHYIFAKEMFDLLYLRSLTVILGGASGGVMGVNSN